MWERHLQTIMLTIMLGVVGYIGSQYSQQQTRISVAETKIVGNTGSILDLSMRMTRSEDRRDKDMIEIRAYLQRIEDKLDKKADKR